MGRDAYTVGEPWEEVVAPPERVKSDPRIPIQLPPMLVGRAVEIHAPDPACYAGQQSIELKATVLPKLYVSLNNACCLMAVPTSRLDPCTLHFKCVGRHGDPHDVCANGTIDVGSF